MSLFGSLLRRDRATLSDAGTILDLVTYAAGLVSKPHDIDLLLDRVRAITSRLRPGVVLTAADEATLFGVYIEIEHYLVTKEPLRSFTVAELRARIAPALKSQLEAYEVARQASVPQA